MNRVITSICGLLLTSTVMAYETVEKCQAQYRVWKSGETLSTNYSNRICKCAGNRAKGSSISSKHLLLCQWRESNTKEPILTLEQ
jgi:hypothetical protein